MVGGWESVGQCGKGWTVKGCESRLCGNRCAAHCSSCRQQLRSADVVQAAGGDRARRQLPARLYLVLYIRRALCPRKTHLRLKSATLARQFSSHQLQQERGQTVGRAVVC